MNSMFSTLAACDLLMAQVGPTIGCCSPRWAGSLSGRCWATARLCPEAPTHLPPLPAVAAQSVRCHLEQQPLVRILLALYTSFLLASGAWRRELQQGPSLLMASTCSVHHLPCTLARRKIVFQNPSNILRYTSKQGWPQGETSITAMTQLAAWCCRTNPALSHAAPVQLDLPGCRSHPACCRNALAQHSTKSWRPAST